MNIIGMMAMYDEPEIHIKRSVRGLARLGVSKLVVADGAYALLPDGSPTSPPEQICVLREQCVARRIALHLHQPTEVWAGNEVEKRQKMLDLAYDVSYDGDWLAIWDCDYRLVSPPPVAEIAESLRSTSCDVATIAFTEDPTAVHGLDFYPMGMLLRAQRGIRMGGNHHTYLFPDGRQTQVLRRPVLHGAEALHLPDVRVLHAVHARDPERRARQAAYYCERDALGVES